MIDGTGTPEEDGNEPIISLMDASLGSELIETSNAIIVGLDLDGNIMLFNSGAQKILGYDKKEILGTSWFNYLIDKDAENGVMQVFKWDIGSGFKTQYENRIRASSGKIITASWENTVIFDDEGEVSMILLVGQDITSMKKMEESLRDHGDRLSRALDEISIYNDLMLHDIKNINTAIMGYLELLSLKEITDDKRELYTKRALSEVKKSSAIINDVKIMSMAQGGIEITSVPLMEMIQASIRRIDLEMEGKSPDVLFDHSDLHVMADDLLEEAVVLLLKHGINGSGIEMPHIEISARRDPAMQKLMPEAVHIKISNLSGIVEGEMASIFSESPKPGEVSSKLDLYLVKKIIDRYGGQIWMENAEGDEDRVETHILLREAV
ncbi:MAG: PAS domain S-box protein [Thermoplasmatota archaeon]